MTTHMDKAILNILRTEDLHNENGDLVTDFENANRDGADFFGDVNKETLKKMLIRAYASGRLSTSKRTARI